ncbi:hypothetical protein PS870_01321 [Pseudomonas fluorescens]|uniref:Uncharacterized protein n=1 Tax=Pseudomonas fluorescens TaxID=294 RepID=A0A5E7I481_PSEFL|nr:hypothetical protein PS870_01321 [Pseudomonas fluorescens]
MEGSRTSHTVKWINYLISSKRVLSIDIDHVYIGCSKNL